ncbi:MAG: Ig-like domain-containing protein [Candidatus Zixiibacteriota bacterium]
MQIELFDGSPVPDSLNTDDDTLVLYCRGYTGYATLLGDYAATWSLIGADSIGTVIPGPAVSTSLTLTTPGTGQIVAEYSPTMIDTTDIMTCQSGFPVDLIVTPVTDTVSADSTLQFTAVSVDADGNPSTPGIMPSWTVLGGIGTINLSGLFTATTAGEGYIVASGLGIADTVGPITVIPGDLAFLEVIPDSTEISADSTLQFEVVGGDADGNINDVGTITWEVIGDIGTIDATGLFTADTAGTGQIAATSSIGGLADTNTIVTVLPGTLVRLVISPDVAAVNINDTVQFSAVGYDADSNLTATGDLTWQVVGRVGDIDSTGLFIADRPGTGLVSSVSSINDVTDTTGTIDVEELYISVVPIGTQTTAPDESNAPVLTFRIDNYYDEDKTVTGFTVRDISRGEGDSAEKLTNADSVNIFLDADEDSLLGGGDVLLATAEHDSYNINLIVPPQIVPADSGRTFIVTMTTSRNPHDGDSLDMYLLSATDVTTEDGTPIAGPDSVNSFGYTVINGMIAAQISLNAAGTTTMEPGDSIYPVLDFTLPRNGYAVDTLNVLTFINTGTAVPDDFDSLMLFKDDGDDVFVDADESCLGKITYTGSRWSISGLTVPLPDETNHFYVGASLSDYPTNGATVVFSIPVGGVEMTSYNDGPLDMAVTVDDTIIIQTSEAVEIIPWTITSQNLIPGEITPALLGFELVNSYVDSVRIDSLHCLFQAVDPEGATQAELDSQVDSLLLYVAVGNAAATFVAGAHLSDGEAVFALDDFSVAGSGGSVNFSIAAALNAQNCKDGNLINIVINDSLEIYFGNPVTMVGEFPIENEDSFPIDAFPAGNITVQNLTELTHFGGQVDRAVFDFTLPGNGYDDGWLSDFSVENLGTLDDAKTITGMYLWADMTGNGLTVDDSPLGTFVNNHGVWRWVGEAHLIPSGGARFYITVNIANESFTAGTLQLSIFREGVVYESGMVGPDDIAVVNPQTHLVFPSNRVTVISFPQVTETILPGASENLVLTFAMYNSYLTQNQNLQALTLSNISHSASSLEFADQELGQVSLFYDKDKNRIYNNDSLIATGYFADGILKMSGLDVILPPESLSYFFVLADLPLNQIDLDSLMVAINSPSDFVFEGAVNVNGDLPLSRGGYLVVDGSVERQYQIRPLSARTLSPGDTSVSLLMFFPAFNGDQMDVLTGLTVNNLEDADDSDISTLELWMDLNGDSLWQDADSLLGTFVYDGSRWSLTGLNVAIDSNPPLLMVLGDISLTATPNVAFRSEIPLNGCQFSSANDGPIDNPLTGSITFPISTSSMRVTYNSLNPTYSVGQDIDLLITVSNILTDSLRGIKSEIVNISDSSRVALQDSVSGPVDLAAGESTGFYYSYSAVGSGSINWQMRATSTDVPDTSVTIQTESTLIQAVPQNVRVNLINNMPTSVTQGQENVFPMSLVISHSDSLSEEAPIRLDSIIMNVESSSGQPLYADDIFSRIVVAGGYDILTILTVIPHQTAVTLVFLSPVIIPADQEMNLTFLMNIDSLATLDDFVLSFTGSASIPVFDNNSLAAVTLDPAIAFPLKTEACRIDVPSHQMMISCTSLLSEFVNIGQFHVPVLNMILRHPEEVGSSQIQLMSFKMIFVDSAENPINAAEVLDRVQVCREQLIIGEVNDLGADTGLVDIQLSMPLALSPGEMDSLIIVVDVKPVVGYAGFGLIIPDSTVFTVRDLSSGSSLTMATDTTRLVAGSVFPITTGWAQLNQAALPLTVCVSSAVPGSTTGGRDSLPLIDISIDYNVPVGVSAVILREISVSVHDSLGMSYDPDRLFDRIGYSLDGIPVAYQSSEYIVGNVVTFRLGSDGLRVNPGEQHDIRLFSDIEADVPYDHFSLSIPFSNNIVLTDATDTSLTPGLVLAAGCAAVFPFITQTAYIYLPAGRPVLETANLPVQNSFPGQGDITLLDWPLTYDSPSLEGEILINELNGRLLQRSSQGLSEVGDNPVFDAVYLMIDDELVAWDSSLSGGVLHLAPVEAYTVARGDSLTLQLKAAIKADAPLGNYVFRFDDSTFLNITDKNLLTQVYAELSNGSYPLYAVEMSLSAPDLGRSFVNYPNPFIPSRGEVTTISYNLSEDAYVDIEIFSITGEAVSEVTLNSLRAQGVHQSDVWAGLNDKGRRVAAGTYFCRITARYVSGREESFRRKIAVIR